MDNWYGDQYSAWQTDYPVFNEWEGTITGPEANPRAQYGLKKNKSEYLGLNAGVNPRPSLHRPIESFNGEPSIKICNCKQKIQFVIVFLLFIMIYLLAACLRTANTLIELLRKR